MADQRQPGSAFSVPRRVFTAPTSSAPREEQRPTTSEGLVETLYHHPAVRIVSFNAGPRPVFGKASAVEVEAGSLAWSSQFERTIAVGPFRIYRAPGSVAFLNCGSALQPILPKSQCWCVDEQSSRFILQIRKPQYWRIELPIADDGDTRLALELRRVLDKVLQFEKTECPFQRSFTVELPEKPQTPIRKRPWTPPVRQSLPVLPTSVTPREVDLAKHHVEEMALCNTSETQTEVPDEDRGASESDEVADNEALDQASSSSIEKDEAVLENKVVAAVLDLEEALQKERVAKIAEASSRPTGFQASRSVTAPSLLTMANTHISSAPAATIEPITSDPAPTEEALGSGSQTAPLTSRPSLEAWSSPLTPLPPSPPLTGASSPQASDASRNELPMSKTRHTTLPDPTSTPITPATSTGDCAESHHYLDELTPHDIPVHNDELPPATNPPSAAEPVNPPATAPEEKPQSPATNDIPVNEIPTFSSSTTSGSDSTYASASSSPVLTRRPYMRHRPTTSSSISPSRAGGLPRLRSAANLFSSYRNHSNTQSQLAPTTLSLVKRLPMAIIHKTIEILLSPPSHLVDLMLKVAARITAGEWRGYIYGFSDQGERIPVRWDWSDEDDDGEGELGGWHADGDWGFGRTDSGTPLKMAGAFPESPDGDDEQRGRDLIPPSSERDDSPSTSRRTSRSQEKQSGNWSVD